ncbi:hypothetical protein D3C81_747180 [compost metagenome]
MNEGDLLDGDGRFVATVQRLGLDPHQIRYLAHGGIATGHALVDLVAVGQRLGVGLAARVAALAALGLGQQGIELVDDGVGLHMKLDGGIAQNDAEGQGQQGQHQDGKEYVSHSAIS